MPLHHFKIKWEDIDDFFKGIDLTTKKLHAIIIIK